MVDSEALASKVKEIKMGTLKEELQQLMRMENIITVEDVKEMLDKVKETEAIENAMKDRAKNGIDHLTIHLTDFGFFTNDTYLNFKFDYYDYIKNKEVSKSLDINRDIRDAVDTWLFNTYSKEGINVTHNSTFTLITLSWGE